jgi:hypothetical protein
LPPLLLKAAVAGTSRIVAKPQTISGRSADDYATQLACLTGISLSKNRLKNRFNYVFSNGDFL